MAISSLLVRHSVRALCCGIVVLSAVLSFSLVKSSMRTQDGFGIDMAEIDSLLLDLNLFSGEVLHGKTNISGQAVNYKLLDYTGTERRGGLVVGVLSNNRTRRTNVRHTWGKNKNSNVVFVVENVNGSWPKAEFYEYGDIVVIDRREIVVIVPEDENETKRRTYLDVEAADPAIAVQTFFRVAQKHLYFAHLMITLDTNFVAINAIERMVVESEASFWGHAAYHDHTNMEQGGIIPHPDEHGYVITGKAMECVIKKLSNFEYAAKHEVATARLLKSCGHALFNEESLSTAYTSKSSEESKTRNAITTGVHTWSHMSRLNINLGVS